MTLSTAVISIKVRASIENNSDDDGGDDNDNNNEDDGDDYFIYNNGTIIKRTVIKSYNNILRCFLFN
jgi:hypothetical protein